MIWLKLSIKSTFQNTTPKDARWVLSFMPSSFLPYNWARNRKIHITFYSRCLTSCRIFRKCIFLISSRGYITYPDRWPGSQVSATYRALQSMSYVKHLNLLVPVMTILAWYALWNQGNIVTSPSGPGRASTLIIFVRGVGFSIRIVTNQNWTFQDLRKH